MARRAKTTKRRTARPARPRRARGKSLKNRALNAKPQAQKLPEKVVDPRVQQQLKIYEEAARYFHQQKFHKAQQAFQRVLDGPSKELADRAQVHIRVCQQRISRPPEASPRTAEDQYYRGIAMMNLGRWDEAREHLEKARKMAPKADFIHYAMAALECLVGEADAALANLKLAIQLRPENRYHARNDEDFASLLEDPRFTELLYPERDGVML
jgi:tetratricopeptide (TPR) repeat protein